MSATSIEWTERTWNPVRGCSRISPGCVNCYAERMAARNLPGMKSPTTGEPFAILNGNGPHWTGKVELVPSMLDIPLKRRKPTTWFVNSMSDLFHEGLLESDIAQVFTVMSRCARHTFQVLTKRSDRMYSVLKEFSSGPAWWPFGNVWLGVSVESRDYLSRIDDLRRTPAAVRFLSLEPLLEDLGQLDLTGIHWVIVGGESGPGARPMHPDWARGIRDQCVAAGVPFFFKQWGEWKLGPTLTQDSEAGDIGVFEGQPSILRECKGRGNKAAGWLRAYKFPESGIKRWVDGSISMRQFHKGVRRLLDGRTWDEMPRSGAQRF